MKYQNEEKIREKLLTNLIESNKLTDRSDNTITANTKTSNKIINDALADLKTDISEN